MEVYEYLVKGKDWFLVDPQDKFNVIGQEGWELVMEFGSNLIFKRWVEVREIEPEPEVCLTCKFFERHNWIESSKSFVGQCKADRIMTNSNNWCDKFERGRMNNANESGC